MPGERKKADNRLYNAVNGSSFNDPEAIEITTIMETMYLGMHNDVSFLISDEMNLYEQQSTYNPNMPNSFVIKQFLIALRAEVMGILYEEYDEAEAMELFKEDGRQEAKHDIALNFYRLGFSLDYISIGTGVPIEIIRKWIAETEDEPVAA